MTKDELLLQRRRKGLTQAELATALGYSRQAIIKWERGVHAIPDTVAAKIIEACQDNVPSRAEAKETAKQQREREAAEAKLATQWRGWYRSTRAFYRNHAETMAAFARSKSVIPAYAYAGIVADFPDILTDPDGDHAMSKNESFAAVGLTPNPEK